MIGRTTSAFRAYIDSARTNPAVWRILLGLAVIAITYLIGGFLAYGGLLLSFGTEATERFLREAALAERPFGTLLLLASFLPLVLGTFAAVRLLHRRAASTLFGPRRRVGRHFLQATSLVFIVYGVGLLFWGLTFDSIAQLPFSTWIAILPLTMLGVAVQTLAEELVFRGYLQQQLAARWTSPFVWIIVPALCFAVLHYAPDMLGGAALYAVFAAGVFGLVAADLTARTGSIGAAWGMHFANNMLAIAVLATQGTITGLALRLTPYGVDEMGNLGVVALADLGPMLAVWLMLRRILRD